MRVSGPYRLLGLLVLCTAVPVGAQESTRILIQNGVAEDGTLATDWIDAIRVYGYDDAALDSIRAAAHPLNADETAWAALIRRRSAVWTTRVDSLRIPFGDTPPPATVVVLLGNAGGQDAFTPSDSVIGFDLARLHAVYGDATVPENADRIDRFFAHEFTHLLHRAWRHTHPVGLDTPLDRALWACLVEGLGNYRSLSARWVEPDGTLTAHARATLDRLQPVFVGRLTAIAGADDSEAEALMADLSMGPFDQKWGALTVALWLAEEAVGDDRRLQPWVEAGPAGILTLAERHLPPDELARLPRR